MTFIASNPADPKIQSSGVSHEAHIVSKHKSNSLHQFYNVSVYLQNIREQKLHEQFNEYKERWADETILYSNPNQIYDHPDYQNILSMGEEIVPFIIEDLRENDRLWFHALQELTGQNPIHHDHRGDFEQMKKDWIDWYQRNY